MRGFQSAFSKCVQEMLTSNKYTRWMGSMVSKYSSVCGITRQYLDVITIDYINMTKEQRLKKFTSISKRIVECWSDEDHHQIREAVKEAAKEYGCAESSIEFEGIEWPEDIEW